MPSLRSAGLLVPALLLAVTVSGCGGSGDRSSAVPTGSPTATLTGPGTNVPQNLAVGKRFFAALASGDAATVRAAIDLAAAPSPALAYLMRVRDGLAGEARTSAGTVTENARGYRICSGGRCHQYSGIVLVDGKVSTFTVDGKQVGKGSPTP